LEKSSKKNIVNDIENRLDDFFDEHEDVKPSETQDISLEKLKSVVLSIDWEITEDCLNDLIDETRTLLPHFENDRFSHTLLRMLKAVGAYIKKRKAQSHPDAIKRIMSVFSSIERLTESAQVEETVKKQIVAKEIIEFKKLKEQVESSRGTAPNQPEAEATDSQVNIDCEKKIEKAMSGVEERLNAQVGELKTKLDTLQKEFNDLRGS
jgi:pilus assembly protein FimV